MTSIPQIQKPQTLQPQAAQPQALQPQAAQAQGTLPRSKILNLGAWRALGGTGGGDALRIPSAQLVTHGVIFGMTGSGKTGLLTVLCEEVLDQGVPLIAIDVKGDLPNLLLTFSTPNGEPEQIWPSLNADAPAAEDAPPPPSSLKELRERHSAGLLQFGIEPQRLARAANERWVRVITPGASHGEPLHVLSSLEHRSPRWDTDPEGARNALSAAVSLVLRLLGREPDPAKSKEHVLLSVLAERRLLAGQNAELPELMEELLDPPIDVVGALPLNKFVKKAERESLAAALNTLLAAPTLSTWRCGAALDVASWLQPREGRTPAVILSVAHLDEEERQLVLGVVMEEILAWVRSLTGTRQLRALIAFDEVYGFLPPHPKNPPTKRPVVALMKQARAFGVGVLLATQNPMDVDYRALSNAGLWFIGRLQTAADRARVLDGLQGAAGSELHGADLPSVVQRLAPRTFVVRNVYAKGRLVLLRPRQTLCWLRGPMARSELQRALAWQAERA